MKNAVMVSSLLLSASLAFGANITGSIKVDRGIKDKDLIKLTKVSLQDAITTATNSASGQATEAEIDNKSGFLVYEVKVVDAEGKTHEIIVDAGENKILSSRIK